MTETFEKLRVLFVHQGRSDFLHYAVAQASQAGLHPIILGNDEAAIEGYEFHNIDGYQESARLFSNVYKHAGRNPYQYELFCFQRWFVARDFLLRFPGPIVVADHDVLIYKNIKQAMLLLDLFNCNRALDSAWFNYFRTIDSLSLICEYFTSIYTDVNLLMEMAQRNAIDSVPHLSDMHLLIEMSRNGSSAIAPVAYHGHQVGFDNNFRICDGYRSLYGHKAVTWENGIPFVETSGGDLIQFYLFHMQGPSKHLMQYMNTIEQKHIISNLPDCERYVQGLPSDTTGNNIRNYYYHLKSKAEM